MAKAGIIIVDDHKLFRDGIKFILMHQPDIEIVAEASDGEEFLHYLKNYKPDLVLMDINMPGMNGIDATRKALEIYPDLKIIIVTMYGDEHYYRTMMEMNVQGFIVKDSDYNEFQTGINTVLKGGNYFSQSLLMNILRVKRDNTQVDLSKRELEVLRLICKGLSTTEVSDELNISVRTVEHYRAELLAKTGSANAISLVLFALKNHLFSI